MNIKNRKITRKLLENKERENFRKCKKQTINEQNNYRKMQQGKKEM